MRAMPASSEHDDVTVVIPCFNYGRFLPEALVSVQQNERYTYAELSDAVDRVASGGSALDPEVVARMLGRRRDEGPLARLSPRVHR